MHEPEPTRSCLHPTRGAAVPHTIEPSQFPSVLFVTAQCAAATGLPNGRRGVVLAPRFQLYLRCAGPCRARGGSCAPVSGASVAQGAV